MIVQSRSSLKFTLPNDWTISRLGLFGRFISGSAFPDQYQGKEALQKYPLTRR